MDELKVEIGVKESVKKTLARSKNNNNNNNSKALLLHDNLKCGMALSYIVPKYRVKQNTASTYKI